MTLSALNAISPIDGRYRNQTESLSTYFSEKGLIRYRVLVEIEYFIALCEYPIPQLKSFPKKEYEKLRKIYLNFSEADALSIKEIEKVTNHDVKAVEYFIKEQFDKFELADYKEYIHFGLTSQDVNNTATPLSLKEGFFNVILPELKLLIFELKDNAKKWKKIPMLARTHGQPASPSSLGKEMYVFVERLENQLKMMERIPFAAKFGGASGNFNAHHVAYPQINWPTFANKFVKENLGLVRLQTTTQIEHYDYLAAFFDNLKRINTILIDLNRDFWTYISMDYFKQSIKSGEVGSSAMPHKVNPIDFENSEGNLGMANAIFEHLSAKLPISRLQRDLTDSTVLRNIGVPLAHSLLAYKSLHKGLDKLILNQEKIKKDLDENWAVIAEAIQTILRRENYANPYEVLKALTRKNEKINQKAIHEFVDNLDVADHIKVELKKITPSNYIGIINF
ncbi:MAG TPA: adenylosuccinate lyase [Bacteroidales bacterium]|nr:adenylosuccinate lyase [Bacteroidales bacterium]